MVDWGLPKSPQKGDKVKFIMPLKGVGVGTVASVDGSYCYITVELPEGPIEIERYWESELKHE